MYGDSLKSCLVAVVLVEGDAINKLATDLGVSGGNLQNNSEMKKNLLNEF